MNEFFGLQITVPAALFGAACGLAIYGVIRIFKS